MYILWVAQQNFWGVKFWILDPCWAGHKQLSPVGRDDHVGTTRASKTVESVAL